ncbi:MAG: maltose ABC transporter permease [Anaerolineaceae bacterium]|nr:maltose ABC transporter permease [Anaerolineaceae bacterium]
MSSQIAVAEKPKRGETSFLEDPRTRRALNIAIKTIVGVIVLTYAVFPVLWTISAAFNPTSSLRGQQLIPANPTLENFRTILEDEPFFTWLWNSIKLATIASLAGGAITTLSAYAFSRYRFWGRGTMLGGILLIQVFPNLLAMVALYALLLTIGQYFPEFGLNSHGGLILIYAGGALGFNVWLMKGFFDSIPRDLDESAYVDGASQTVVFFRIILPLVRPMIAVVMVLSFFGVFGDWFLPNLMLTDESLYPLMLGLQTFIGTNYAQNWGPFAAGAVLGAIPQLIVYFTLQDWIVGGLTAGSVKG